MKQFGFRKTQRPHPLILAAAASVISFSLLGVGTLSGLIPSAYSSNPDPVQKRRTADESLASGSDATRKTAARSACTNCGFVDAIRTVQVDGKASGLGAVAGGVTGAVVGNQIGSGHGRDAMTLLGGVGGAFAGNSIEKNITRHTVYRVTVRMDDGSFRTVSQAHEPAVGIGSKVRIINGSLAAFS
jgi:outer membrane lipoprotein SlyB